ncbi:hypothetical protein [Pseudaestuariivita rosea]|uniref:hypothetical protein n=1 Tax=Pseudaestuariivita rosea TaxID=2763263 RepID=UPI001ABB8862|nr:hypothetical protein [Pseudaestuariivita rosea]
MDDDDKGVKDNTSPDFRPKYAKSKDKAPGGHMGREPAGLSFSPTGTSRVVRVTMEFDEPPEPTANTQDRTPPEDTRPTAIDPNDSEVEAFYNEYRYISEEEAKGAGDTAAEKAEPEDPQPSQTEYAKAFRRARDRTIAVQREQGLDWD